MHYSYGPVSNEQHGELLEMPQEGADGAGGSQSSAVTPVGTGLYQAAQVQLHGELAMLLLLPVLHRAKADPVISYSHDLIFIFLRVEFSLPQTM